MANASSNLVTPQKGLVSTNPFLGTAPSTGGSTSVAFAPTHSGFTPATPQNNFTSSSSVPTVTGFSSSPTGGIVPVTGTSTGGGSSRLLNSPVVPATLGAGQNSLTQSGNTNTPVSSPLNATPGQTYAQYEASQGFPQSGTTSPSSGVNSTFPGLVSSLATTASQPSPTYTQNQNTNQQVQSGLINLQDPNSQLNQPVTADTNAVNQLQDNYATQQGIIGNSPIGLSEQGGEQGLLNSQYATKLDAAQTALNTATTNRQQQIGALESAGGLANTGASNATAQQGTQQSGTATAAGLAQPSLAAPGQSSFNPQTGQFGSIAGAQNGGGIASVGGLQTQIGQGAAVQQMTGTLAQAQGLASTLTSAINSSGYNPAQGVGAATTYANGVNQWLQTNSGNPQYQNVANLISEVANKYAAILNQSGGTPTSVSQVQEQIINGLASGQQIETTLQNLATNAQTSINALQSASGTNSVNGTSNTTTSGSSQYDW